MKRNRLVILPGPTPWLAKLNFWDPELKDWMKQFPGCEWQPKDKAWTFPIDLLSELKTKAHELGYKSFYHGVDMPTIPGTIDWRGFWRSKNGYWPHKFQADAAPQLINTLTALGSAHVTWEMGLGKTIAATLLMRTIGPKTTVVICPASAVGTWEDELEEWLPGVDYLAVRPTAKKRWQLIEGGVNIVSYGLLRRALKELPFEFMGIDAVIADEIHHTANPNTYQAQAVKELFEQARENDAWTLGMTGTLVSDKVQTMHNPLDLLYPGRFGRKNHFCYRHMESTPNDYGLNFFGAREDTAAELQSRLALTGSRITKNEVMHLLPPLIGPVVRYADGGRVATAVELALDAMAQGETHVSIQAAHLKVVDEIKRRLEKAGAAPVFVLTGATTPKDRDLLRKNASECDRAFVVSTIQATREAISLTFCGQAIYAELVDSLKDMLQNLGRYQRLTVGGTPTTITFVLENRQDKQALRMAKKIKAYGMVLKQDFGGGRMEEALAEVQAKSGLTKEEVLELAKLAGASFSEDASDTEVWHGGD
jgi:superfamily II DNA or RNA helicase